MASIIDRGVQRRHGWSWRTGAALLALLMALLSVGRVFAGGVVWLPARSATHGTVAHALPSLATDHNHAYILTIAGDTTGLSAPVYYTTNAFGAWRTTLLSAKGPHAGGAYLGDYVIIAVDPTIKPHGRLYAVWNVAGTPTTPERTVLYTSNDEGAAWTGPLTLATGSAGRVVALAAGKGTAAVAIVGSFRDLGAGPCSEAGVADLFVVTYNGATWAKPRNLSSCLSDKAGGFDKPKLAFDATTALFSVTAISAVDGQALLWYAQGSGSAWAPLAPTPLAGVGGSVESSGSPYDDYRLAAAGGAVYVAYTGRDTLEAHLSSYDIRLAVKTSGQAWTVQRVTRDPANCEKYDVALAALPGRVALAYTFGSSERCQDQAEDHSSRVHVLTGSANSLRDMALATPAGVPSHALGHDCYRPAVSSDGGLFRVVDVCDGLGQGANLFYQPEFFDIGPIVTLTVPSVGSGAIHLSWSEHNAVPGFGVVSYQAQVRDGIGPWQDVTLGTTSTSLAYTQGSKGHSYTFRVRGRDGMSIQGDWAVSAAVPVRPPSG